MADRMASWKALLYALAESLSILFASVPLKYILEISISVDTKHSTTGKEVPCCPY